MNRFQQTSNVSKFAYGSNVPDNERAEDVGFYEKFEALYGADPLLILRPGEAKREFQQRLQNKHFPAKLVDVATADKMTDRQVAAKVREYFEVSESRG